MTSVNEEPIKAGSGRVKTAMGGRHRVQPYSKGEARTRAKMGDKGLDRVVKGDFYRAPRYIGEKGSQDEAKTQFWRMIKWVVPIAIGVLICMLTLLVRPVAKLEVEVERLHEEARRHSETIRALERTVGRMHVENKQLRRDIERLREDKPRSGKENGRVPRIAQFGKKGRSFRKGQEKQVSKR